MSDNLQAVSCCGKSTEDMQVRVRGSSLFRGTVHKIISKVMAQFRDAPLRIFAGNHQSLSHGITWEAVSADYNASRQTDHSTPIS